MPHPFVVDIVFFLSKRCKDLRKGINKTIPKFLNYNLATTTRVTEKFYNKGGPVIEGVIINPFIICKCICIHVYIYYKLAKI